MGPALMKCLFGLLAMLMAPAVMRAQDEAPPQKDNGTDPTKLRRTATVLSEYMDLLNGATRGTLKLQYEQPIAKSTSLRVQFPVSRVTEGDQTVKDEFRRGDIAVRLNHIYDVNRERGIVLQLELSADSASSPELGSGKTVVKGTFVYAWFLKNGAIFAPSFGQSESVGGDPNRPKISNLVVDFYYVPKLADPRYFMTVDPAVTLDWENDRQFASLAVTFGRSLGAAFGGQQQIYVKPSALAGSDRTADWGLEIGYKVIGF